MNLGTATIAFVLAVVFVLAVFAVPGLHGQTLSPLHEFKGGRNDGGTDGAYPHAGLTMDQAGNLYGTTSAGGLVTNDCTGLGCGTVYKLLRKNSGWLLYPLYNFQGGTDGQVPEGRLTIGPDGSLYGTAEGGLATCYGSSSCGVVFNLRPPPGICRSFSCPWTETILYRFTGGVDGWNPGADLTFDRAGNLYGIATDGGYTGSGNCVDFGCGVVYKLTPSNGSWTESVIYQFLGGADGENPWGGVIFDTVGNLYGITAAGGVMSCEFGCGTVFQLSPTQSGWVKNTLHPFQGGNDGYFPETGLTSDRAGNLYGSTASGGPGNGGTIFQLTSVSGSWVYSVIYGLSGQLNSQGGPAGPLTIDQAANLYGAATGDGAHGVGSIFKLTPSNGSWLFTDVHDFGGEDGAYPYDGLVVDSGGNVYGTALQGGQFSRGLVFVITP